MGKPLSELQQEIRELARERKAIILAHNYQPPEIQEVADLTGDSLELSLKAAKTDAEVIVFCGVRFMAETAAIVSPDKLVVFPRLEAGCEMADMIAVEDVEELKARYPGAPVVTYVNSYVEIKAVSDICCTSANAVNVVRALPEKEIIFIPDMNLARYTQRFFKDKKIHYFEGFCPFHDVLTVEDVEKARKAHPEAVFMAHPECRPEVIDLADVVRSTSGMLRYARESQAREFIVGTEVGLIYPLKKQNPDKEFYPASEKMLCKAMKIISLEDLKKSLETLSPTVKVPEDVRVKAYRAVARMLEIPRT
ncbi:quinolinate synthase NadA [Thermodesulfatator autotrophicus]|uniref:Quinolinate synthase n=1 Tax=Thermodesulfatator autotrophicus TaxID=1795632 RepID=A0A177E740_9BACT|nr:quinolinate synthase NadA [Thermodesulfatator autotrophicus]OAG27311.1 quinolinate synthetase [Thermodesulfatator autotrophicus]